MILDVYMYEKNCFFKLCFIDREFECLYKFIYFICC